jgi:hypothetical protein
MDKYKLCIGVDIGIYNFAFTINENNSKYKHIHINFNNSKLNLFQTINLIVNYFNFKNYFIKIEKQLQTNTKCIIIQTILETILNINNIEYTLISSQIKYKQLKNIYNIEHINKKKLQNYININYNNCLYYIITNKLIENDKVDKMDDIIDSLLICIS